MAQTGEHYDGCRLLSMKDIDGLEPGFYISETNRNGGKTTYFSKYLLNRYKKFGEKFILLVRKQKEIPDMVDKFFEKELKHLFPQFKDDVMTMKYRTNACYSELFLNGESCGYVIALSAANEIRLCSRVFVDADTLFYDEMQLEDMAYGKDEVTHFLSIIKSIARGRGKAVRPIKVIMACNPVSILNPYYVAMGIHTRIKQNGEIFRGKGWVIESAVVKSVQEQANNDAVSRAFEGSKYIEFANNGVHMISDDNFIGKLKGKNRYVCTLRYKGKDYGVREYKEQGLWHVSDSVDHMHYNKIAVTKEDHTINYIMDGVTGSYAKMFRDIFACGSLRFKDNDCKNAMLDFIAIR